MFGANNCRALIPGAQACRASRDTLACIASRDFPHRRQEGQQTPVPPAQLPLDTLASEAPPAGSSVAFFGEHE